jgi:heptosyltransferase-2
MRGKILVIRGGAIGDFILTLPAIAALRLHFPEAHLEVLGYPHIAQLALAGGLVNRVQAIEARPLAGFFARGGELVEDMADYFSEFDLIVSFLYDPDRIFETNVRLCSPAQFIVAPHRPDEEGRMHATEVYLKPLERLAIFDADAAPRLSLSEETADPRLLAAHPGSGSERKNWPERKWAELLSRIMETTNYELLLIGGEAEAERLQRLRETLPAERVRLVQSVPLVELGRLMQECALFIGHDSGISHLAGALGLPGVILWGHSAQHIWRPPSEKMMLLEHPDGLEKLEIKTVLEALKECFLHMTVG